MNIKRTLKRLIDEYVAALEKQNDLLKENLQQKKSPFTLNSLFINNKKSFVKGRFLHYLFYPLFFGR